MKDNTYNGHKNKRFTAQQQFSVLMILTDVLILVVLPVGVVVSALIGG